MPTDRDIIDDRDSDGTDDGALAGRLGSALNVQRVVTRRLGQLRGVWRNPGPPQAPQLLTDIIAEAEATIAHARAMQATR
ncbi:MAG: hypothetical protein KF718_32985 [Polyangiaceae bacterium]|nr:hypothetical protein [Polyangiaceae bacterium]